MGKVCQKQEQGWPDLTGGGTIVCVQKNVENLQETCTILGKKSIHLKTLLEMFLAIEILFFLPAPGVISETKSLLKDLTRVEVVILFRFSG